MVEPREVFSFSKDSFNSTTAGIEISWKVPTNLPYFDGHFPGQPVLPGVAILDASMVAIETTTDRNIRLKEVSSAKFTGLVEPEASVKICLKENAPGEWEIQWFSNESEGEKKSLAKIQCKVG